MKSELRDENEGDGTGTQFVFHKTNCVLLCLDPLLRPLRTLQNEAIFSLIFKTSSARKLRKKEG
jgi:hypothetical protein